MSDGTFDPTLEDDAVDVVSSEAPASLPPAPVATAPKAPATVAPAAPAATAPTQVAQAPQVQQAAPAPVAAPVAAPAAPQEPEVPLHQQPIAGMKDSQVDGLELPEMARITKEILSKEPRIPFVVPFDPGEKKGAVKTCIINGYRFDIPKNTMVHLPKSVVEFLMQCAGTAMSAVSDNEHNLANADAEKRRALGV